MIPNQFYPLLFEPNLHTVVWGGNRLRPYKRLSESDEPIGESWEVSAIPTSSSIISNGQMKGKELTSVIEEYPEQILGKHVNEKYFDCDDWVQRVNDDFRVLKPIHDFLDYVYDE